MPEDKKENKKQVNVNGDEKESKVGITKSKRWADEEKNSLDIKKKVSDLYERKDLSVLQKPIKGKGTSFLLVLIIALIVGGLAGIFGAGYILENNQMPSWLPFEINKDANFTTESQENNQNNSNLNQNKNVGKDLVQVKKTVWTIFKEKNNPDNFLSEIYAPWQSMGVGVVVREDGWLLTSADLNQGEEYVALDSNNKIAQINQIINDPKTGISLVQISKNNLPVSKILNQVNLSHLDNLLVLDKLKNTWMTNVSDPDARNIYKTEDLVRSTDEFKSSIRVNNGTILERAPGGILFKDKDIVGFMKGSTIIPAWILAPKINNAITLNRFNWPYAGIEYLRLNEAPGLLSDQFRELEKGAIVYGDPVKGSPGLKAGLQNADIITRIGEREVKPGMSLTYIFQAASPGDKLNIEFTRKGKKMNTIVNLGKQKF